MVSVGTVMPSTLLMRLAVVRMTFSARSSLAAQSKQVGVMSPQPSS